MQLRTVTFLLSSVLPAYAQFGGPAILSRGEAPATLREAQLKFVPYVTVSAIYDTGLATVAVNDQGNLATGSSTGVMGSWGISGSHGWRHTRVGLAYHGSGAYYSQKTLYNSINHSFLLGVSHEFSAHTALTLRESAGVFSRDFGLATLNEAVPFDPAASLLPTTDFFDNRTEYLTSQADFIYQRSVRTSFSMGGGWMINSRQSPALAGVRGAIARGDVQHRLTRRSTVGGGYDFSHFVYTRTVGGTDAHSFNASYSMRLTRTVEFSGYAGAMRVESKFITVVPIDPVIAQLLNIQSTSQIVHQLSWSPAAAARLTRKFRNGVLSILGQRTISPGNGLFLTSIISTAGAYYTYTGVRRWSFTGGAGYTRSQAVGDISGVYSGATAEASLSRRLSHGFSFVASSSVRQYGSPNFANYDRLIYQVQSGVAFSPGDIPLRIW